MKIAFQRKAHLCPPHLGMGQHSPRLGQRVVARTRQVFLWGPDLGGGTKMAGMAKEQSEWPSVLLPRACTFFSTNPSPRSSPDSLACCLPPLRAHQRLVSWSPAGRSQVSFNIGLPLSTAHSHLPVTLSSTNSHGSQLHRLQGPPTASPPRQREAPGTGSLNLPGPVLGK